MQVLKLILGMVLDRLISALMKKISEGIAKARHAAKKAEAIAKDKERAAKNIAEIKDKEGKSKQQKIKDLQNLP